MELPVEVLPDVLLELRVDVPELPLVPVPPRLVPPVPSPKPLAEPVVATKPVSPPGAPAAPLDPVLASVPAPVSIAPVMM
jgi:hypothetical protein